MRMTSRQSVSCMIKAYIPTTGMRTPSLALDKGPCGVGILILVRILAMRAVSSIMHLQYFDPAIAQQW